MGFVEKLFSEEEIKIDRCDKCREFHNFCKPTEKGWLCRKCLSQEKIAFQDQSEEYFWDE